MGCFWETVTQKEFDDFVKRDELRNKEAESVVMDYGDIEDCLRNLSSGGCHYRTLRMNLYDNVEGGQLCVVPPMYNGFNPEQEGNCILYGGRFINFVIVNGKRSIELILDTE